MSYNIYSIELMAKEKQREIEKEVHRLQLLARAKRAKPGIKARLFHAVGELFSAAGAYLKNRYPLDMRCDSNP